MLCHGQDNNPSPDKPEGTSRPHHGSDKIKWLVNYCFAGCFVGHLSIPIFRDVSFVNVSLHANFTSNPAGNTNMPNKVYGAMRSGTEPAIGAKGTDALGGPIEYFS